MAKKSSDPQTLAFAQHDHGACAADALDYARGVCAQQGLRLTPVRERVLQLLLESHSALGAYDLLEKLKADGLGSQPPVAYRALEFLVAHGFAHKIERLNAFVACSRTHAGHSPAFMICRLAPKGGKRPMRHRPAENWGRPRNRLALRSKRQ
ncbi:MAG: hypothetical protein Ct9H300mP13_0410 [Gammaproteobacteria bacterium]|nr:MAG: hypothetical protein Ct9H300mP13_0410 [Gammaproteobacteria bacterium]